MTFFLRFVSGAGTEYASYTSSPYNQYASSPYAGYSYNPTGTSGLLSRYFAWFFGLRESVGHGHAPCVYIIVKSSPPGVSSNNYRRATLEIRELFFWGGRHRSVMCTRLSVHKESIKRRNKNGCKPRSIHRINFHAWRSVCLRVEPFSHPCYIIQRIAIIYTIFIKR